MRLRNLAGMGPLFLLLLPSTIQARASTSVPSAWNEFLQTGGRNWNVHWERGAELPDVIRPAMAEPLRGWSNGREAAVRDFFFQHADLFGLKSGVDDVIVKSEREYRGIHHVKLGQLYHGLPVLDTDYMVSVRSNGVVSMIAGQFNAGIECDVSPKLNAHQAEARARREVAGPGGPYRSTTPTMGILRVSDTDHLVYVVELRGDRGAWRVLVDAHDGTVVRRDDLVQHATGCLSYYPDDPFDALEEGTVPIWDQYPAEMSGPQVRTLGSTFQPLVNDGAWDPLNNCWDFHYDPVEFGDSFDQANAYWHALHFLRDFHGITDDLGENPGGEQIQGSNAGAIIGLGGLGFRISIQVRRPGLFEQGAAGAALDSFVWLAYDPNRQVSFANVSDVVYHEIQHVISWRMGLDHYNSAPFYSLSFNESFSNYFACAANEDGVFMEYYSPGGLFNPDNSAVEYNYGRIDQLDIGGYFTPYIVGMIWSGTLWDLRESIGSVADEIAFASYLYLPSSPTFPCGAAALVQADLDYFGGSHEPAIQQVLQNRGFGVGPPLVTIAGPGRLSVGQGATYTSSICCGILPYQLQWTKITYSAPGVDGAVQNLGTSASVTTTFSGPFRLELRVTDGRASVTTAQYEVRYPIPEITWSAGTDLYVEPGVTAFNVSVTGGAPNPTFEWTRQCRNPGCLPEVFGTTASASSNFQSGANVVGKVTAWDEVVGMAHTWVHVNGVPGNGGIGGPSYLGPGQTATFTAFFSGGTQPYTYRWAKDCYECVIGTGPSVQITGNGSDFTLWVNATSAAGLQSDAAYKIVDGDGLPGASNALEDHAEPTTAPAPTGPAIEIVPAAGGPMTVNFTIERAGPASLRVIDVTGRVLSRLHEGILEPGRRSFVWDSRAVTSGIYFVVGTTGGQRLSRRAIVIH